MAEEQKSLEMRVAELEDKLSKVMPEGAPAAPIGSCVVAQCIVNACIANQCIFHQCIIRQCIVQQCFECSCGPCAPAGGISGVSGAGFGALGR